MPGLSKSQRQHRIMRLLETQPVSSQTQLVALLAADDCLATQATVSRDLEEIGAIKVRMPGGTMVYAVPEQSKDRIATDDHLKRVMREFVVGVVQSGNLVMVHTPVGSAHVVASAIDRNGIDGVLGTVAGDDTLLLVVDEDVATDSVATTIRRIAGLDGGAA